MTDPVTSDPRRVAIEALVRIETDGAFANLVVPNLLSDHHLDRRDRAFVTELVYGSTRRRRALDHLIDPFLMRPPPAPARAALRIGAYQLSDLATPAHAAVSATVGASPKRFRGLVNAVLRRVSQRVEAGVEWPDRATELSYPDWIVQRLHDDLGEHDADAALRAMNSAAIVHRRADGYIQDRSSQLVTETVVVSPGSLAIDVCAAPGGKATAMAGAGATVIAVELHPGRARRMHQNRDRLGAAGLHPVVADATTPPLRPGRADLVLVDAPCSGLGALRRRPDARWRIADSDIGNLVLLQNRLLGAAAELIAPGGTLAYSVCTLTRAETVEVADRFDRDHATRFVPTPVGEPWRALGTGGLLLPDEEIDGMALFCWRRSR